MPDIAQVCTFLDQFAPAHLAEEWDNVGLLVGDRAGKATKIMTCLTVTQASAHEAISRGAQLIVTHHPFPFRAVKRLTRDTPEGGMLLDLIAAGVAVYSPHTAFDSAAAGINQQFADGMGLTNIRPLIEKPSPAADGTNSAGNSVTGSAAIGSGRIGELAKAIPLADFIERVKSFLSLNQVKYVGDPASEVRVIAIACGSAGEFLDPAQAAGADCFVTGETSFHTCLAAEATDTALVLTGHFASERFAVVALASILGAEFAEAAVWASELEQDPIRYA